MRTVLVLQSALKEIHVEKEFQVIIMFWLKFIIITGKSNSNVEKMRFVEHFNEILPA